MPKLSLTNANLEVMPGKIAAVEPAWAGVAAEWGKRQFSSWLPDALGRAAPLGAVAVFGAGVAAEWVTDICAGHGVDVAVCLDDFQAGRAAGRPLRPVAAIAELKIDTVVLATIRNEERLRRRLADVGFAGKVIGPAGVRTADEVVFAQTPRPRGGLPGRDWPLHVQIQTTSVCNARCLMCPYSTSWHKKNPGRMDEKLYQKILDDLEHYRLGKLCLYLQNEPLADPRWLEWAARAIGRLRFARFELSTNLSLLTPELSERLCALLRKVPHEVWISFQGCDRESYERIMGLDFATAQRNLAAFAAHAQALGISFRVHAVAAPLRRGDGRPVFFEKDDYERFLNRFADERGLARFRLLYYRYHDRAGNLQNKDCAAGYRRNSLDKFYCHRVDTWIHVQYTGEIVACCHDYRREHILGDLRNQRIKDYFQAARWRGFRDQAFGWAPSPADFICKRCLGVGG